FLNSSETKLNGIDGLDCTVVQIVAELLPLLLRGLQGITRLADFGGSLRLPQARAGLDRQQGTRQPRGKDPESGRPNCTIFRRDTIELRRRVKEQVPAVPIHSPRLQ